MKTLPEHFRSPLGIFVCLLLIGLISTHRTATATTLKPNIVVRVWSVGDPLNSAAPRTVVAPDLQVQAEKLGYTIVVQNFRAAGFADVFHEAVATHSEPEVITFDNVGILIGATTNAGI